MPPVPQVDVSGHMRSNGVVEAAITSIFFQIFQEKCDPAKNGGKRGLFVDVGANFGWFSVLAASQGCRCVCVCVCACLVLFVGLPCAFERCNMHSS